MELLESISKDFKKCVGLCFGNSLVSFPFKHCWARFAEHALVLFLKIVDVFVRAFELSDVPLFSFVFIC